MVSDSGSMGVTGTAEEVSVSCLELLGCGELRLVVELGVGRCLHMAV